MAKRKGECCPVGPDQTALNYNQKINNSIKLDVRVKDAAFVPEYHGGQTHCTLRAFLKDGRHIPLGPGHTENICCGLSVKLQPGYALNIKG